MKQRKFEISEAITDQVECTDFILVDDDVYAEDEVRLELIDDLAEVIDEDMLYESYRDRDLFGSSVGKRKSKNYQYLDETQ